MKETVDCVLKLLVCLLISSCLLCSAQTSSGNLENVVGSLLKSIDKLLKYCRDNYQDATLDTVFGLRIIQGQCQRLIEEYEAGRLEMSMSGSAAINATVIEIKRIAKEAGIYANMAVPHLRERDQEYFNLMSKLTISPWKLFYPHRLVDLSTKWKTFGKGFKEFTESESDVCIGELLGSGSKSTGERCQLTKGCLQRMLILGQSGRQLQRQIFYTILSQMVRCERYLNEYLIALTKFKNVDELQHELCSNAYFELFDSTSLTMNDADLFAESQFYCPSIGYFQFLKREWLDAMISWQSPKGCFPSSMEIKNIAHIFPITTSEKMKDNHNNPVNYGKDHSYAEAAAYDVHEHANHNALQSATKYGHVQGYLEPTADFGNSHSKTANQLQQVVSVENFARYARNNEDLHGTQSGNVIQYPSVVDGKYLKYYQFVPIAQDRHYLGVQRRLQSTESQINGKGGGNWLIHDKISDGCRSHLTSVTAAALSIYLRYLVDVGPSEFFQMRLDLFKMSKSTPSTREEETDYNSSPKPVVIKPLPPSRSEHGSVNAYHDRLMSNDQKPISINLDNMHGEARKYMGIYQRHWVPQYGTDSNVGHQLQNEHGSNPSIIDYVNRSNKLKDLPDWTVVYSTTVKSTINKPLITKLPTTTSLRSPFRKSSVIVTPVRTELPVNGDQINDVQIIDMQPDWIQRDLGRYFIAIMFVSVICLVVLFRYFCHRKSICKGRGRKNLI